MRHILFVLIAGVLLTIGCVEIRTPVPTLPRLPQPPLMPTPIRPIKPHRPHRGDPDDYLGATVGGRTHADGTDVQCDLPGEFQIHNSAGTDGAGLCVFASMHHAGVWQSDPIFEGLFTWMKRHPGGGYPQKVDAMVQQFVKEKGGVLPIYIQVEDNDLEILRLACANGYMPGVTYSFSPTGRYNGQKIAHMVNIVCATASHFVILDNNYPGIDNYEWLSPSEFLKTYSGQGQGWTVILLSPSPPPPPRKRAS